MQVGQQHLHSTAHGYTWATLYSNAASIRSNSLFVCDAGLTTYGTAQFVTNSTYSAGVTILDSTTSAGSARINYYHEWG